VPQIALDLSRGCGAPVGFAGIQSGEVVVDLGCGAGIDLVLAVERAGSDGRAIGIDFSSRMIERAHQAVAEKGLADRVELHVGDIAKLELPDSIADVVISNCVVNLCPDKDAVYHEAYRILKPGGRLAISDITLMEEIAPELRERFQSAGAGCLGGAIAEPDYWRIVSETGFRDVQTVNRHLLSDDEVRALASCPGEEFCPPPSPADLSLVEGKVASVKFTAAKPSPT